MAYIPVQEHLPGITGLLEFRQDTAKPIRELTQFILRGENSLTPAERELIATAVSGGNECKFCTTAHAYAANRLLGETFTTKAILSDPDTAPITPKIRALITIALQARENGRSVTPEAIEHAKQLGATDVEIHDTVLIAALFCLYNRYVDGLGTSLPASNDYFDMLAERLATTGYVRPPQGFPKPEVTNS
ncbi:MAG: peroxidase-related enzyme [Flavitalea sp.]